MQLSTVFLSFDIGLLEVKHNFWYWLSLFTVLATILVTIWPQNQYSLYTNNRSSLNNLVTNPQKVVIHTNKENKANSTHDRCQDKYTNTTLVWIKKKINEIDKQPFWSHILLKSSVIGLLFTKPNTYGVHKELKLLDPHTLKMNNNTPYVHTKY